MNTTKEKIVKTAIALFKENGYEETTINKICKECGITKGTFYYHFANKDELTFAFYDMLIEESSAFMPELLLISNSKEQLWRLLELTIDSTLALTPPLLKALLMSDVRNGLTFFSPHFVNKANDIRKRNRDIMVAIIKKGQVSGEIKQGDPDTMLFAFFSAITGLAFDWASNNGNFDQKAILIKIYDLIF